MLTIVYFANTGSADLPNAVQSLRLMHSQVETQIVVCLPCVQLPFLNPEVFGMEAIHIAAQEVGSGSWVDLLRGKPSGIEDLIVLIDQQIQLPNGWVGTLIDTRRRYPDASALCLPVRAVLPEKLAIGLRNCRVPGLSFGQFAPKMQESSIPRWIIPFGSIVAIAPSCLEYIHLDARDPKGLPPRTYQSAEIIADIYTAQGKVIFVPQLVASYTVSEPQTRFSVQFERAFDGGYIAAKSGTDVPILSLGRNEEIHPAAAFFELGMELNFSLGQLVKHAELGRDELCRLLCLRLAALGWQRKAGLLCHSAEEWLAKTEHTGLRQLVWRSALDALQHQESDFRLSPCLAE